MLGKLAKFWVGAGGAIITSLESVYAPSTHWLPIVSAAVSAVLVYLVPNASASVPPAPPQS